MCSPISPSLLSLHPYIYSTLAIRSFLILGAESKTLLNISFQSQRVLPRSPEHRTPACTCRQNEEGLVQTTAL